MDDVILKHVIQNSPDCTEERTVVFDQKILKVTVTITSTEAYCSASAHVHNTGSSCLASSYCVDCSIVLCPECWSVHQTDVQTSSHDIINCGQFPDPVVVHSSSSSQGNHPNSQARDDVTVLQGKSSGKPEALEVDCTSIVLSWPRHFTEKKIENYEVRYRRCEDFRWKKEVTDGLVEVIHLKNLIPNASYEAQLRPIFQDEEGPYGEKCGPIRTKKSVAQNLRDDRSKTVKLSDGTPSTYRVQLWEKAESVNKADKTRKCTLRGKRAQNQGTREKTVLLVGATGSGKTTLIDAMFNYALGIEWSDDFRFTVVNLKDEEDQRKHDQAMSQTDWITCYEIPYLRGSKINYQLNLVDTPGFADTRGIERDTTLVRQIRSFFTSKGALGIKRIDAICFVTQAPLARLSAAQRYVFDGILSIFGKDVIGNIFMLITFADGSEPVVLSSLKEASIPYEQYFTFNNSALFAENGDQKNRFSESFWYLGQKSYEVFFEELDKVQPKSLTLTAEVLERRERLDAIMIGLVEDIKTGLNKMEDIRQEESVLKQNEAYVRANKNFRYKVNESRMNHIKLKTGENATNCLKCHRTCHYPCNCLKGVQARDRCTVIDSMGKCTVCIDRCHMQEHCYTGYRYELTTVEKERTYEELKKRYEEAVSGESKSKAILKKLRKEHEEVHKHVQWLISTARDCFNQLNEIALRTNPLTETDYIDLLILNEKQEGSVGYLQRVKMLEDLKQKASFYKDLPNENFDPLATK